MRRLGDERGQTTIVMAMLMGTFLLGFVALGVDVESLFRAKRMAQTAADSAVLAAAEEYSSGSAAELAAASAMAKLNGFDTTLAKNPPTVTVSAPTSGSYSGSSGYVQVVVSMPVSTIFLGVLNHKSTAVVSARAVAAGGLTSPTCVCLEAQSGMGLSISNGAQLTATGCGVTVDSSSSNAAQVIGNGSLNAVSIGSVSTNWYPGNVSGGGRTGSTKVVQGISTQCSPALPAAPSYSAAQCTADPLTKVANGGSSYSVGPNSANSTTQNGNLVCYSSMTVGANGDTVNLNPGIYVINGGALVFQSGANGWSNTGGNGVFFYLVGNASVSFNNGANVNLVSPSSGPYAGILFFQDPGDSRAVTVQGGTGAVFSGAIYAPSSAVTLSNGSSTGINADIVAQTLTMNGGAILNSTANPNMGTLNLSVAKIAE